MQDPVNAAPMIALRRLFAGISVPGMGPLTGIKVIEFAGIGPCPMAAMMLAEMGATVLRIDRVAESDLGIPLATKFEVLERSRSIIRLDLKRPEAVALTLRLVAESDALIEGFRPKVME